MAQTPSSFLLRVRILRRCTSHTHLGLQVIPSSFLPQGAGLCPPAQHLGSSFSSKSVRSHPARGLLCSGPPSPTLPLLLRLHFSSWFLFVYFITTRFFFFLFTCSLIFLSPTTKTSEDRDFFLFVVASPAHRSLPDKL